MARNSARFVPFNMPHLLRPFLAAVLVSSMCLPAWAEKADRFKPMNAEADSMRHDDLRQLTVLSGNVVITKGSIVIRGNRVEVSQTPDGFQRAQVTAAPGALAFYRSKRDGVDEFMEGEAELIDYDGRSDTVVFTRRAVLRRYVGATVADETTGAVIRYDNSSAVFAVEGGPRGATGGRVRALLSPRQDASAPAAAPTPGTPALRPSMTLGTDKR